MKMAMKLLSFHSDPKIKRKYLSRVRAHAKADEIIKGNYWWNGKGCAVGCTIHSNQHDRYQTELGLPEWLARLEDTIFEGLPNGKAKSFPVEFLKAIPDGVDLEPVKWKFCAFVLRENIERVLALSLDGGIKAQVVDSIRGVLKLHEGAITFGSWDESAARSAANSAMSAARSAAADSAAWSARSAADSAADSARSAANSAAWSARSAAWSARSAAAYVRYRDELLWLLKDAK